MKNLLSITMIATGVLGQNSENNNKFIEQHKDEYLKILKNNTLTKNVVEDVSYISLPVSLYVFNRYYKYYYSEYQYLDKYKFNDKVFIFDKESGVQNSEYKNARWLENLEQTRSFTPTNSVHNHKYMYDESYNINWINGQAGKDAKLKNILQIRSPEKTSSAFSKHVKNIVLNHNFKHGQHINEYSGYWKEGRFSDPNTYFQVNYGKLKEDEKFKHWYEIYTQNIDHLEQNKRWQDCQTITKLNNGSIGKNNDFEITEGFDSKCDQISLHMPGFAFNKKTHRYTTGYAAYRNVDTYWSTQNLYYYLLGNLYNESQYQRVNEDKTNETLWYVDYDNVFMIDVEKIDHENKKFDISIKINNANIENVTDFLTVSSGLSFNLNFQVDGENKTTNFTMDDLFNKKTHTFSFSNFKPEVMFENMNITLQKKNDYVELISNKKYSVSRLFDSQKSFSFDELIFKMPQNNELFYSEMFDKRKLQKFFYLKHNEKNLQIQLDSSYLNKLNIRVKGSDTKECATLTYLDLLKQEDVTVQIKNLRVLPKITSNYLAKGDKNVEINKGLVVSSDYFWNNISLELKGKNVFDGIEKYTIQSKHENDSVQKEWNDFYQEQELWNHTEPYIKRKITVDETNLSNNFYVTENGKKNDVTIDKFNFSKTKDTDDYFSVFSQFKNGSTIYSYHTFNIQKNKEFNNGTARQSFSKEKVNQKVEKHNEIPKPPFSETEPKAEITDNKSGNLLTDMFSNITKQDYPLIFSSVAVGGGVISAGALQLISYIKRF